jgi:uncharacterized repeat protein (TIGR03803 family)
MRRQPSKTTFPFPLSLSTSVLIGLVATVVVVGPAAQAQNYSVLHSFSNGYGGSWPWSELTLGHGGHLYGTTFHGGNRSQQACQVDLEEQGCGIVFDLYQRNDQWVFDTLFAFQFQDGAYPHQGVIIGHDGALYGAAGFGGQTSLNCSVDGCGTVYELQPSPTWPSTPLAPWMLHKVYDFMGTDYDGSNPSSGLVLDAAGNMYGGNYGGPDNCGVIYQLSRSAGGWMLSDIYNGFYCPEGNVGIAPGGLVFDGAGNLYGTTFYGGHISCTAAQGCGTVFKLTNTGSAWVATTLYEFNEATDGGFPGGLVLDAAGNLYGGTESGGPGDGGTVWELSASNGGWTFNVLYSFQHSTPYAGVVGRLAMDSSSNLYGVTASEGTFGLGNVFMLTPSSGAWTYADLHDFSGGNDGADPLQGVTLDTTGDIFGTTSFGGLGNYGTVWEMAP